MSNRTSGNLQLAKAALSQSESSAPVSAEYDANMEAIDSAISSSGGGSSPLQTATVTLSAAQLKTFANAPFEIVPSPGPNKFINVIQHFFLYKFGTVPFNPGQNDLFQLLVGAGLFDLFKGANISAFMMGLSSDLLMFDMNPFIVSVNGVSANDPSTFADGNIQLSHSGIDWTQGDGTLTVTVYYTVVTLS